MTQQMTEAPEALDELGPVDWIVVEFRGSKFTGEIAPILKDYVDRGLIRILDLAFVHVEDDVNAVAASVEPGSTAALLVWENRWAAPFGSAVRRAGGQLVASGRIPIQALLAAVEAEDADEEGE